MKELIDITKTLLRRRRYRNLSIERIEAVFSNLRLNEPSENFAADKVLSRIKKDAGVKTLPPRGPSYLKPALAAAALVIAAISIFLSNDFYDRDFAGGQIVLVSGEAFFVHKTGKTVITGSADLAPGEKIVTGAGSSLDIFLGKEVVLRAGENSELVLKDHRQNKNAFRVAISLERGSLFAAVKKKRKNDSVIISTGNSITKVHGTLFSVFVSDSGKTRVSLFEGKLEVRPAIEGISIAKGENPADGVAQLREGEFCSILSPRALLRESKKIKPKLFEISRMKRRNTPELRHLPAFVAEHKDYVRDSNKLIAGKDSGKEIKDVRFDRKVSLYFLPAGRDGSLIKVRKGNIIKISAKQQILWSRSIDVDTSVRPVIRGQNLFIALAGGRAGAISIINGSSRWVRALDGSKILSQILSDDSLFVATEKNRYYRINRNGAIVWANDSYVKFSGFAALTEHLYLVTLKNGTFLGFDLARGIKVIRKNYTDGIRQLAAYKNRIYVITGSGKILLFDYRSDEVRWEVKLPGNAVKSCIAAPEGVFIFHKSGIVLLIDNNGNIIWKKETGSQHVARPVLDGNKIYILTRELFLVLNRRNGTVEWTVVVPPVIEKNLSLTKGKILFYTHQKGLHVLKK